MLKWTLFGKLAGKNRVFYGASMIVIRVDAFGNLADSKPCAACTKILKHYKIKKIYYSVPGGLMIENVSKFESSHLSYAQKLLGTTI